MFDCFSRKRKRQPETTTANPMTDGETVAMGQPVTMVGCMIAFVWICSILKS